MVAEIARSISIGGLTRFNHFASVIIAVFGFILLTCSEKPSQVTHLGLNEPIDIELGQAIIIEPDQLSVTFANVSFDYRCPLSTSCPWPGIAEVRLSVKENRGVATIIDVAVFGAPETDTMQVLVFDSLGYQFELLALEPSHVTIHPVTHQIIGRVVAKIIVTKAQEHGAEWSGSSRVFELPLDSIPATDAEILSSELAGNVMSMTLKVANPCTRHYFELNLLSNPSLIGDTLNFTLWLRHTTKLTLCSVGETEQNLTFSIEPFLSTIQHFSGTGQQVKLNLRQFAEKGNPIQDMFSFSFGDSSLGGNVAPTFDPISPIFARYGERITFDVHARDPEREQVTISVGGLPDGATFTLLSNGSGRFSWLPKASQTGEHLVTFTASDGVRKKALYVSLTVRENHAPTISVPGIIEGMTVQLTSVDTFSTAILGLDTDGDSLSYKVVGELPGHRLEWLADQTGMLLLVPAKSLPRSIPILVRMTVSDGIFADTSEVFLQRVNTKPQFIVKDTTVILEEGSSAYVVLGVLNEDGDELFYRTSSLPDFAYMDKLPNDRVQVHFHPNYNQHGIYQITVFVEDGSATDQARIVFDVSDRNAPPELNRVGSQGCAVGQIAAISLSAEDGDGDPLTFSMRGQPPSALLLASSDTTAEFIYSWKPEDIAEYRIQFNVSDGITSDSEEIVFVVAGATSGQFSLIPMQVGNYWVYSNGDSLAVWGSLNSSDMTWWYLSEDFDPFTTKVRISSDTIFSTYGPELIQPEGDANRYPVYVHAENTYRGDRSATALSAPVTVPAGTFSGCIKYTSSNPNLCYISSQNIWMGTYNETYIVAPGVGIIQFDVYYKLWCSFNSDFRRSGSLLRFQVNTQ